MLIGVETAILIQTGGLMFWRIRKLIAGLSALFLSVAVCAQQNEPESDTDQKAIKSAIEAATGACALDIAGFCSNVTPGDGRQLACLQAYEDQVSHECAIALEQWDGPDVISDFQTTKLYPSLEDRELGEPQVDEEGERVIWPHRLPFMAQSVIDLGFELPKPYGVAVIPVWLRQDLVLTDLAIGIDGPPETEIDFVDFGTPFVENTTLQLKFDAWVLPFMNVFATVGKFDGKATIPLSFVGSDLFPDFCRLFPNNANCVRTFSAVAKPEYEGENVSLGINLAMGWDRFFVTIPATYAWTSVDIIPQTVTAVNITPRIGMTGEMGERGTVAVFIGATYLDAEVIIADEIVFDTPGGPEGDQTLLSFRINQRNKDKWNYLIGFNWEMNRSWSVNVEAGFGGSRENVIAGATYRF